MSEAAESEGCPLAAMVERFPGRVAIRAVGTGLTYGEFEHAVRSASGGFTAGEVVAFPASACLETMVTLLAVVRARGIALPLNPGFPQAYVEEVLGSIGPCRRLGAPVGFGLPQLHGSAVGMVRQAAPYGTGVTRSGVIVLTSGSTGVPKAALLSLGNLCASARMSNRNIVVAPGDHWLLSLPLYHVSGLGVLFRCLVAGAAVAVPGRETPLLAALEDVTHVSLVAAQLHRLLEENGGVERLHGLKAILLGGSGIPEGLLREAHAAHLPIHTSYGLTEAASQVTTTPPGADLEALLTSGVSLHPDGLRFDGEGQILVGGPTCFLGYYRAGGLETPFDAEGYFATGDLGRFDEQGRLVVTGRRDNRFIVGGENVQPEEIERCLCRLPGVRRAVVVGVPHDRFGNTPVAFVEGGSLTLEGMREALAEMLPAHKIPRRLLPWPNDLTPEGGKILRQPFAARVKNRDRKNGDSNHF